MEKEKLPNLRTAYENRQEDIEIYNYYKNNLRYNLIETQKYTFEELLIKKILFTSYLFLNLYIFIFT